MENNPFGALAESLISARAGPGVSVPVIAAVGGGGKTASLFCLASFYADSGASVALTTTTHIRDPRFETERRRYDRLIIDPDPNMSGSGRSPARQAGITVLGSAEIPEGRRISGFAGDRIPSLCAVFDVVLVEADGSRGLPVKAPAAHEPVIPAGAGIVLGLVGVDCLGKPLDDHTVHRCELFAAVTGCKAGEAIRADHLAALARSGEGLFKGKPDGALRILVLNKADLLTGDTETARAGEERLRDLFSRRDRGWDAVILCSHALHTAELISSYV